MRRGRKTADYKRICLIGEADTLRLFTDLWVNDALTEERRRRILANGSEIARRRKLVTESRGDDPIKATVRMMTELGLLLYEENTNEQEVTTTGFFKRHCCGQKDREAEVNFLIMLYEAGDDITKAVRDRVFDAPVEH